MVPTAHLRRRLRHGGGRGLARFGAGILLLLAAACSSSTGPSLDAPLRYTLVGFNAGGGLPVTFADSYTVLAGSLVLRSDGTCAKLLRWRIEADPPVTNDGSNRCVWTRSGDEVEITVQLEDGQESYPGRMTKTGFELTILERGAQCAGVPCPSALVEIYRSR